MITSSLFTSPWHRQGRLRILSAIALAAACLTSTVAWANEILPFAGAAGGIVCKNWTKMRASAAKVRSRARRRSRMKYCRTNFILETSAESWILGFMSGTQIDFRATTAKESIFCETNDRDIIHRTDLFCKANPESLILQAAAIVSSDLMRKKAEAVQRALDYKQGGFVPDVTCWPSEQPD